MLCAGKNCVNDFKYLISNHWASGNACYKCNKIFADEGSAKKHFRQDNLFKVLKCNFVVHY